MIVFDNVSKTFRHDEVTTNALLGLSFRVAAGEFVGYAGPNGAGKSTSIKAMTGLLSVTSGTVRVRGLDPLRDRKELTRNMGVVFGQRSQLFAELSTLDAFDVIRALYRVDKRTFATARRELIERLDMGEFVRQPVRTLSLGQRMRAELAGALIHQPSLLLLDEPTIGLDLEAKDAIRSALRHVHEELGTTIVLTTHDLSDIEALCDRLLVIGSGRIAFDGSIGSLRSRVRHDIAIDVTTNLSPSAFVRPGWTVDRTRAGVRVSADARTTTPPDMLREILRQDDIGEVHVVEPTIEDVLREIYAGNGATTSSTEPH